MRRFGPDRESTPGPGLFLLPEVFEEAFREEAGAFGQVARFCRAAFAGIAGELGQGANTVEQVGLGGSQKTGCRGGDCAFTDREQGVRLPEEFGALLGPEDFSELQKRRGLRFGGLRSGLDHDWRRRGRRRFSNGDATPPGRRRALDGFRHLNSRRDRFLRCGRCRGFERGRFWQGF